jgi:hypothetical protein
LPGNEEKGVSMSDTNVSEAIREANEVFARMGEAVEAAAREGVHELDVLEITKKVGLEIDEGVIRELQIPRLVPCHPWLPWYVWWPWRPFWCWWWRFKYPWYGWCCPWWWHRCHWYPL